MNLQGLTKQELISLVDSLQGKISNNANNHEVAESLLELAHEFIAIVDSKKLVWVNHRTEELTGWTKEELLGKSFLDFVYEDDKDLVIENHIKIMTGADSYNSKYKFRIYNKNGEIVWVENRPSPYFWKGKRTSISFMLDINEYEKAARKLEESKIKYETVVQNSLEAIIVMRDFKLIFMNRTTEQMFDEKYENLIGGDIKKFIHPDDLPIVVEAYKNRLTGRSAPNKYIVRLFTSKKEIFYGEISAVILDWEGEPASMSFISNVTEKVLANKKLEILNNQYKTIIENSLEGIFIHSDSIILFVNQAFADILKKSSKEILGKKISDVINTKDANLIEYNSLKLIEGEAGIDNYQVRAIDSEGNNHWLVMRSVKYDWQGKRAILNFVYDITDQKEAEKSLLDQNELLETLINSGTEDIICFLDTKGRVIKANKNFIHFFGLRKISILRKTIEGLSVFSTVNKEYFWRLNEILKNSFFSQKIIRADIELESSNRTKHIFDLSVIPLKDNLDRLNGLVFSGRDVTAERSKSKRLIESEKSYRETLHLIKLIADSSPNLIWAKDLNGKYMFTNDKFRKLFLGIEDYREVLGKEESEFINNMLEKYNYNENLFSFDEVSKSYEETVLKSMEPITVRVSGNLNAEHYDFSFYIAPLFSVDGELIGTIGTANDITNEVKKDKEIKANEKNFRLLIHNFPHAILITRKSKILFYNNAFKDLSGLNDEEIDDLDFITLIEPADRSRVLNFFGSEYKFKTSSEAIEFQFITKDMRTLSVKSNSFITNWGDSAAVITVLHDITDEKKHLIEILRLSKAIEQSPVGILITDLEHKIVFANSYITNLTGYMLEEIIGENADVVNSDTESCNDIEKTVKAGQVWRGEVKKRKKNGDHYWALCTVAAIKDKENRIINYLYVQFDTTERKEMIEELVKARDEAKKADRLKAEFLTQISHEIRSPINALLSFSSMIKYEIADKIDDDLKYAFDSMENAGQRLVRTVDLILNMSEVQTGAYDYRPTDIDVSGLLAGIYLEMKPIADRKGIELKFDDRLNSVSIYKDEYTIKHVFLNIIDNAIKYTDNGSVIIKTYKNEEGKVVVSISDTGIGISEKYLSQIFDPFTQEDQGYTRKYEGNGLGLSLVKQYLELNKAELSIQSEKGAGSTFTVTF